MAKKAASSPLESILGTSPAKASELLSNLTQREQQVAVLMADGLKNTKIAKELKISTKTLDIHRANLKKKLRAQNSVQVARLVFAEKLGEHMG